LGRKFVRVALGGVRDEAEIRGHRRTYVGAAGPHRACHRRGWVDEPVVLLDEIDVGSTIAATHQRPCWRSLTRRRTTFRDHYLDLDLDLSDVVFLATANVIENIRRRCWTAWSWCRSTATPPTTNRHRA
jgi:ATP-dependent Lon protease